MYSKLLPISTKILFRNKMNDNYCCARKLHLPSPASALLKPNQTKTDTNSVDQYELPPFSSSKYIYLKYSVFSFPVTNHEISINIKTLKCVPVASVSKGFDEDAEPGSVKYMQVQSVNNTVCLKTQNKLTKMVHDFNSIKVKFSVSNSTINSVTKLQVFSG